MPTISTTAVAAMVNDLEQQLERYPVQLGEALLGLVRELAASADDARARVSADAYIRRGMAQWDRDRARLKEQTNRVFLPSVRGEAGRPEDVVPGDVTEPIARGVWPAWLAALPQYTSGVVPGDPLLPPTARPVTAADGQRTMKTLAVAETTASLWSQAHVAAEFDRELGAERLRAVLTKTAAAFEVPDDTGNEGEANVWQAMRDWAAAAGEIVGNASSGVWDTGGIQTALMIGAGVVGLATLVLIATRR